MMISGEDKRRQITQHSIGWRKSQEIISYPLLASFFQYSLAQRDIINHQPGPWFFSGRRLTSINRPDFSNRFTITADYYPLSVFHSIKIITSMLPKFSCSRFNHIQSLLTCTIHRLFPTKQWENNWGDFTHQGKYSCFKAGISNQDLSQYPGGGQHQLRENTLHCWILASLRQSVQSGDLSSCADAR